MCISHTVVVYFETAFNSLLRVIIKNMITRYAIIHCYFTCKVYNACTVSINYERRTVYKLYVIHSVKSRKLCDASISGRVMSGMFIIIARSTVQLQYIVDVLDNSSRNSYIRSSTSTIHNHICNWRIRNRDSSLTAWRGLGFGLYPNPLRIIVDTQAGFRIK